MSQDPKATRSQVALCIADELAQMCYGVCHNAAIEIRRLVPFEDWYEEQVAESNRLNHHLILLTQQHGRLSWRVQELVDDLNFQRDKHAEDRARLQAIYEHQKKDCWYWQGDGQDHLESMVNTLPVVITAGQLRGLIEGEKVHLANEEKAHETSLEDRDRYHEMADLLAAAIGKHFGADIGEHSSGNCPWKRALEVIAAAPQQALTLPVVPNIEAAAMALAEAMDYPWEGMTEQGRDKMRKNAEAVVKAAKPLIGLPVSAMSAPREDAPTPGLKERPSKARRALMEHIGAATEAVVLMVMSQPDPCPSCDPGLICKKPTCGRLESQHALQRGFTLIELLIVVAVLGILGAILAPALGLVERQDSRSLSWGFNGVMESRCVGGYQHTIDHRGRATQTLGADGFGITCK